MEVNLSRIHTLIAQTMTDIRRIMDEAIRPLEANGEDFIFQIFESTADGDIQSYQKRLEDKKGRIRQRFGECRKMLEYSFYLRRQLDAANRSFGVAEKLLELNNIKKMLAHLYWERQVIAMSCSQGLDELKGANYYKTSFTEKQRVYDLALRMFSEQDYARIQAEINETEKISFRTSNEIAFLNQTTVIEILSYEDFKNSN